METLLSIHSALRWLIVAVGILAALKFLIGWLGRRSFTAIDRGLRAGFTGLVDLQVLLGIILLLWKGWAGAIYRLEHAATMIIVLAIVHLTARWKSAPDKARFRNSFLVIVIAFGLIYAGVARLPVGWSF